jgi:hypothetical protein
MMCSGADDFIMPHGNLVKAVLESMEIIILEVFKLAAMLLWLT